MTTHFYLKTHIHVCLCLYTSPDICAFYAVFVIAREIVFKSKPEPDVCCGGRGAAPGEAEGPGLGPSSTLVPQREPRLGVGGAGRVPRVSSVAVLLGPGPPRGVRTPPTPISEPRGPHLIMWMASGSLAKLKA